MLLILGAVFVVLVIVSALAGNPDKDDETAGQQVPLADITTTSEAQAPVSTTPRPTEGQAASLEAELAAIYPGVPEGKYLDWSVAVCSDILRGITGAELEGNVVERFAGGGRPDPTPEQAGQMLEAITTNGFCTGAAPITTTTATTTTTAPPTTIAPQPVVPPTTAPPPTEPPAESVYYANCDAVRAAGAAPIYRGEPGYRSGLDRDDDGIACDVEG